MTANWTSRLRVETALSHKEPDRVPTDLSITLNSYVRLREYLGLPVEEHIEADRFYEVRPSLDLLDVLGVDMTFVRLRSPQGIATPPPLPDGTVRDAWGIGRKQIQLPNGSYLNEVVYSPWSNLAPEDIDLNSYDWPDPHAPGYDDGLAEEAHHLFEDTSLALMGRFGGPILEMGAYLRGFEQWLMDLVLHPQFCRDLLEIVADIQIALDSIGIKAAGRYLTVFKLSGEDLGMQDRPLFSMRTWREVIYPPLARRWRAARQNLDQNDGRHVKLMLHSDGAIRPFIPDIMAAGVDLLDPVQGVCEGMALAQLKRDFGENLAFHGSVNTQGPLPFGAPADVEQEVRNNIQALGKGGGLILAPSHFLQPDVPSENIVALYQASKEHGIYPL